jgi:nicotinate phosphoribosyltransferase
VTAAGRPEGGRIALATDLYELTMGATYVALGIAGAACFSLLVRKLPATRPYLVVAGLEDALARLSELTIDGSVVDYLRSTGRFDEEQLRRLLGTRFTGDVWAVPEGRVVFSGEPLLEVKAPILEAQLVETLLLNAVYYPTLVASKAARCVGAAPGKPLVDFGMRRMPGTEASVAAARACYLAGFAATSNVLAGRELGIPVSGTVAHSLIELFPSELEAFRQYSADAHGGITLLVDTYDTLGGVRRAIQVARELGRGGRAVEAIRLDSGDLLDLARRSRAMLDEADLHGVRIVASGGLDEYELARLERGGAPIDGYGIGTRLGMSADAPVLDLAYKIVEYDGRPSLKLSEGKATVVGPKQVWRRLRMDGQMVEDVLSARDEPAPGPDWAPLLEPVMSGGRAARLPTLRELRAGHEREVRALPPDLRSLQAPARPYPVRISAELTARQQRAVAEARRREGIDGAADAPLHAR